MSNDGTLFSVGDVVVVSGLQSRPELNSLKAQVTMWDPERGRYTVRFFTGPEMQEVVLAIKPINMSKAPPPPAAPASGSGGPPPPPSDMVAGGAPPEGSEAKDEKDEASAWIKGTTPEGRAYWYNTVTEESSWLEPAVLASKSATDSKPR